MSGYSRWAHSQKASIGNDLVFLPATRPERTCLPRFYSRILTAAETDGYRRLASSALPFDHYVWLCWSVKEAVYKYQKRLFPALTFAPLRFEIGQIDPPKPGEAGEKDHRGKPGEAGDSDHPGNPRGYYQGVAIGPAHGQPLYSRTIIRDGVIMTVVSEDQSFADMHWGFSSIDSPAYADQSAAVRTLLLGKLKTVLPGDEDELRVHKDPTGCPIVLAGDRPLPIPISLAHHDRYVGYSFRLNKVV